MKQGKKGGFTRREFIKATGVGVVGLGVGNVFIVRRAQAAPQKLKILQWSHFVPRYDKDWFDNFAQKWGKANDVDVTVDHIGLAEIGARTAAEIGAGEGHDLIEWISPPAQFEPSVLDLTDVNKEAEKRFGKQHPLCV